MPEVPAESVKGKLAPEASVFGSDGFGVQLLLPTVQDTTQKVIGNITFACSNGVLTQTGPTTCYTDRPRTCQRRVEHTRDELARHVGVPAVAVGRARWVELVAAVQLSFDRERVGHDRRRRLALGERDGAREADDPLRG